MKVDKNLLIKVQYTLYASGADGKEEQIEKTSKEVPLIYIQGLGQMLPEFERLLLGLEEGESFDFKIAPELAYGTHMAEYVTDLPKDIFKVDGKIDTEIISVGNMVPMMDAEGHHLNGKVLEIKDDTIKMDFNHPLADMELHFIGHVEEVREPTAEEVQELMQPAGGCSGCGDDHQHEGGGCCGCH